MVENQRLGYGVNTNVAGSKTFFISYKNELLVLNRDKSLSLSCVDIVKALLKNEIVANHCGLCGIKDSDFLIFFMIVKQ